MPDSHIRGQCAWQGDGQQRFALACQLAGIMAELGVQQLTLTDPRACRARTIHTRESDLPRLVVESLPGTAVACPDIELLLHENHIEWIASERAAAALSRLSDISQ